MVKKLFVIVLVSIIFCGSVSAESYFENENGVILTKPEYDFIVDLYNENYPSIITMDEYNVLKNDNIFGQEITRVSSEDKVVNQSINLLNRYNLIHETTYKKLEMSSACGTTKCRVFVTLDWKKHPVARSYDLIGAQQVGSSALSDVVSHKYIGDTASSPVEYISNSTGASATYRLPNDNSSVDWSFDFAFSVAKQGRVTATYQHATKNITLANSRKFTFHYNGYGHVYMFDDSVRSTYDAMDGLEIVFN